MTPGVADAFLYLTLASARNRILGQFRRMRQPRYLLAVLLGALYLWWILFWNPRGATAPGASFLSEATLERWTSLALFILFMRWWLFGRDRSALAFTPAEVQFLFTAPMARRQLIQFKLLRAQVSILIGVLIWVVLLGRGGLVLHPALRALSLWGLFSFFTLHRLGATLVRTAATEHGRAGVVRNLPALAIFGAITIGLLGSAVEIIPALRAAGDPREALRTIDHLLQQPLPRALLSPFRLLLAPTLATSSAEWLATFPWVLVLLAAHYLWVIHSDAAFEEAAVEASVRRARQLEAFRARRAGRPRPVRAGRRQWLRLAPTGHPAGAIVWKNLVAVSRTPSSPVLVIVISVALSVMIVGIGAGQALGMTIAVLASSFAFLAIIAGVQFVRNDLRQDLLNIRLLRTYPLAGSTIVGAEVASATIVLTAIQLVLLLLAHAAFFSVPPRPPGPDGTGGPPWLAWEVRTAGLLAAVPVLIAINAATVTIQNAAALLFPAWVHLGLERTGGVEVVGQNILTMLASFLVLALALIPPGIVAVLGVAGARLLWPDAGMSLAAVGGGLGVVTLLLEVAVAVTMLGEVFERGDIPVAAA